MKNLKLYFFDLCLQLEEKKRERERKEKKKKGKWRGKKKKNLQENLGIMQVPSFITLSCVQTVYTIQQQLKL